jgi:hypothetical protein
VRVPSSFRGDISCAVAVSLSAFLGDALAHPQGDFLYCTLILSFYDILEEYVNITETVQITDYSSRMCHKSFLLSG